MTSQGDRETILKIEDKGKRVGGFIGGKGRDFIDVFELFEVIYGQRGYQRQLAKSSDVIGSVTSAVIIGVRGGSSSFGFYVVMKCFNSL